MPFKWGGGGRRGVGVHRKDASRQGRASELTSRKLGEVNWSHTTWFSCVSVSVFECLTQLVLLFALCA